jgi:hypothetical protein
MFILAAFTNIAGYNASSAFLYPVGLAIVSLVIGIAARRRVDIVLSVLIILAIPLFFLGIIVMFALSPGPILENNALLALKAHVTEPG